MSGETDVEIYASLTDLDFEFNALRCVANLSKFPASSIIVSRVM